jgi:glutathione S-transferase
MKLRLIDWGPSPFCLKVRAILEHKALPYERVNALGAPILELYRRGGIGKVPALDVDGELVCDSTEIAYALERIAPTPSVVPADVRERALCHVIEDWADESVYWIGIYYQWHEREGRKNVPRAFGRSLIGQAALRVYDRRIQQQLRKQGIARKPEAMVQIDLERALDAVEGMLAGRAFVLGDTPYLCDFALLGQLVYLKRTPVGGRAMERRAAIDLYLERMKALRAS